MSTSYTVINRKPLLISINYLNPELPQLLRVPLGDTVTILDELEDRLICEYEGHKFGLYHGGYKFESINN